MTNFTFSSVSSVIFTVGWLAYGIVTIEWFNNEAIQKRFTVPAPRPDAHRRNYLPRADWSEVVTRRKGKYSIGFENKRKLI